jgi:hypothetical protein
MCFDYARNSYHDEFIDFPSHSYSRALPRTSFHDLSRTSSRALSHFSHGPNHRSCGFGSQENNFMPRRFGYGPRLHRGDHFLLESLTPTLSPDTWTVYIFPVVVHVSLVQKLRCKR